METQCFFRKFRKEVHGQRCVPWPAALALDPGGEMAALQQRVGLLVPRDQREQSIQSQVVELLRRHTDAESAQDSCGGSQMAAPGRIQDYAQWRLHSVRPVSKHSAVYSFHSEDEERGTPIRKGRGGRTVWSRRWRLQGHLPVGRVPTPRRPLLLRPAPDRTDLDGWAAVRAG